MEKANADSGHIWHNLNLAALLFGISLGSAKERKTLTKVRIWDGLNLDAALVVLSLCSV